MGGYTGEYPGEGAPCAVCGKPYKPLRQAMCRTHYRRIRKHGHPHLTRALGVGDDDALRINGWRVAPVTNCWEWSGHLGQDGYGKLTRNRQTVRAHRLAYETWVGPIPEGHVVRHKCDNPPCINPDHLETGTPADNTRDMYDRGRAYWQRGVVPS